MRGDVLVPEPVLELREHPQIVLRGVVPEVRGEAREGPGLDLHRRSPGGKLAARKTHCVAF